MARVDMKSLTKRFGDVTAVDAIDLEIADGEFVAILGPSGCGKSTTLFLLSGIEMPNDGVIAFDGKDVTRHEAMERGIGLVFQSYALYPHMTVLENIMFPLEMMRLPKPTRRDRAIEAAGLVQIGDLIERRPHQLSGGQQQRVALARALVKEPRLLLLDEPLSNLDASLRYVMRSEIRRLQRRLALTTVLVTHDQIEATTMADRIVVMNKGRIEQVGTADDLYRRPANSFVAGFIGSPSINLISSVAHAGRVQFGDVSAMLARPSSTPLLLGFRPEHLRFADTGVAGRIVQVEPMGREVLYEVETGNGILGVLQSADLPRLGEGNSVHLAADAHDMLAFDIKSGKVLELQPLAAAISSPRHEPELSGTIPA